MTTDPLTPEQIAKAAGLLPVREQTPDPHPAGSARVTSGYGNPLSDALAAAAALTAQLRHIGRPTVTVYLDEEDGDAPTIDVTFDATGAGDQLLLTLAKVKASAAGLDLEETTEDGATSYRQWEGEVRGRDVILTVYLPAPRRRLAGLLSGIAARHPAGVLSGIAAAGALAGLGARRAILALVR
jgi:hypothetical protein